MWNLKIFLYGMKVDPDALLSSSSPTWGRECVPQDYQDAFHFNYYDSEQKLEINRPPDRDHQTEAMRGLCLS